MSYAQTTSVPVERTRAEIEGLLRRRGATAIASAFDQDRAMIGFQASGRQVRIVIRLPQLKDFKQDPRYRWRTVADGVAEKKRDQEERRIWRALLLTIKAKFEAIESKIETFDEAFLPHVILPGGGTVGDHVLPKMREAYETGQLPPLLPAPRSP